MLEAQSMRQLLVTTLRALCPATCPESGETVVMSGQVRRPPLTLHERDEREVRGTLDALLKGGRPRCWLRAAVRLRHDQSRRQGDGGARPGAGAGNAPAEGAANPVVAPRRGFLATPMAREASDGLRDRLEDARRGHRGRIAGDVGEASGISASFRH